MADRSAIEWTEATRAARSVPRREGCVFLQAVGRRARKDWRSSARRSNVGSDARRLRREAVATYKGAIQRWSSRSKNADCGTLVRAMRSTGDRKRGAGLQSGGLHG